MRYKIFASALAISVAAGSALAIAETTKTTTTTMKSTTVTPIVSTNTAVNANVATAADQSPVVLTGTIQSVSDDEFVLSYGSGNITVEMEDWNWNGENMKNLRVGDRVTVTGQIDDDLFEGREIEADNIYLTASNVYYYREGSTASPIMGTAYRSPNTSTMAGDGTFVAMSGRVSNINGKEFTLTDENNMTMQVDTGELGYDPLDAEGVQRVREGDMIQVYGEVDEDFFERKEILASRVISLMNR